jgi:hypothetical protein
LTKDYPKKLPTLNESSDRRLDPTSSFNDSFSKYQSQQPLTKSKLIMEKPFEKSQPLDHSIVDKISRKFRINEQDEDEYQGEPA